MNWHFDIIEAKTQPIWNEQKLKVRDKTKGKFRSLENSQVVWHKIKQKSKLLTMAHMTLGNLDTAYFSNFISNLSLLQSPCSSHASFCSVTLPPLQFFFLPWNLFSAWPFLCPSVFLLADPLFGSWLEHYYPI